MFSISYSSVACLTFSSIGHYESWDSIDGVLSCCFGSLEISLNTFLIRNSIRFCSDINTWLEFQKIFFTFHSHLINKRQLDAAFQMSFPTFLISKNKKKLYQQQFRDIRKVQQKNPSCTILQFRASNHIFAIGLKSIENWERRETNKQQNFLDSKETWNIYKWPGPDAIQ